MNDDPFERAVERAHQIAETAREERSRRRRARSGELNRRAFRIHISAYVFVSLLILATWYLNGRGYPWFVYPILGWAVAVAVHLSTLSRRSKDDTP